MAEPIIVAIDGGAGTGTSTVAQGVAEALGIPHLNTGSMYRAFAWECLRQLGSLDDEEACGAICEAADVELTNGAATGINGHDVSAQLYSEGMGSHTSRIAGYYDVREAAVKLQRQIGGAIGAVVEGRDIGTHVFPGTSYKFFFTCEPQERVRRVNAGGRKHETVESLLARDVADQAHIHGTFKKADDAVEIDTSPMGVAEVVTVVLEHIVKIDQELGVKA